MTSSRRPLSFELMDVSARVSEQWGGAFWIDFRVWWYWVGGIENGVAVGAGLCLLVNGELDCIPVVEKDTMFRQQVRVDITRTANLAVQTSNDKWSLIPLISNQIPIQLGVITLNLYLSLYPHNTASHHLTIPHVPRDPTPTDRKPGSYVPAVPYTSIELRYASLYPLLPICCEASGANKDTIRGAIRGQEPGETNHRYRYRGFVCLSCWYRLGRAVGWVLVGGGTGSGAVEELVEG